MLKLILAAVVVAAVTADLDLDTKWTIFKATHGKKYTREVDEIRKFIWSGNMKYIENHNKMYAEGLTSYILSENEFADMTNSEFVSHMNGLVKEVHYTPEKVQVVNNYSLPATVDWRPKGYVTPIKNQGQCGSCWAFSATGSTEGQHFKATGKLVSLSEQNLVDCSTKFGNQGCQGGLPDQAFKYVIANKGIDTEASYPYKEIQNKCQFQASNIGATISSYKDIPKGSESALQQAVAEVGPISVGIDASHMSFQFYHSGVYDPWFCSHTKLDHGVLVVGYGTEGSRDYWLVKNSWGSSWGEKGYIKMIRNDSNKCGIATLASYPVM